MTVRKVLFALFAAVVVVGLGFAVITAAINYDKKQQRIESTQLQEFRWDLVTNGFATSVTDPTLRVAWKEEADCKGGNCTTEKELDADIIVAGCPLQAERSEEEADQKPNVRNGIIQMRPFKLDEWSNGSKDGVDLEERGRNREPFTKPNPTRTDVYQYLEKHGTAVFPCFKPDPKPAG